MMQRETPPHERASTIGFAYAVTFSMIVVGQIAVVPLSNVLGQRATFTAAGTVFALGGLVAALCWPSMPPAMAPARPGGRSGGLPRPCTIIMIMTSYDGERGTLDQRARRSATSTSGLLDASSSGRRRGRAALGEDPAGARASCGDRRRSGRRSAETPCLRWNVKAGFAPAGSRTSRAARQRRSGRPAVDAVEPRLDPARHARCARRSS